MDAAGRFCWVDLAASDAAAAQRFYAGLFGWTAGPRTVPGGCYLLLRQDGQDVASMYQLRQAQLAQGVPSHWTPYVRVADADAAAQRAATLGGTLLVAPFDVPGAARIALIHDPVGALVGLWQDPHDA
jgi:uncharacterized protein